MVMVICLEQGADLHMAQLMPLLLTVSCFSKIQIGFTFLVLANPGSPGKRAVKRVCACVCVFLGKSGLKSAKSNEMGRQRVCYYYYVIRTLGTTTDKIDRRTDRHTENKHKTTHYR